MRCCTDALVQCVTRCCEKFMHLTGRVGMRFNEFYTEVGGAAAPAFCLHARVWRAFAGAHTHRMRVHYITPPPCLHRGAQMEKAAQEHLAKQQQQ
jgi:hypothetical protein